MRYIIDRFEGEYALCETEQGDFINIERNRIPHNAREGDVLAECGNELIIDFEETEKRKEYVKKLADELWT